jgi:hypothetical protein
MTYKIFNLCSTAFGLVASLTGIVLADAEVSNFKNDPANALYQAPHQMIDSKALSSVDTTKTLVRPFEKNSTEVLQNSKDSKDIKSELKKEENKDDMKNNLYPVAESRASESTTSPVPFDGRASNITGIPDESLSTGGLQNQFLSDYAGNPLARSTFRTVD